MEISQSSHSLFSLWIMSSSLNLFVLLQSDQVFSLLRIRSKDSNPRIKILCTEKVGVNINTYTLCSPWSNQVVSILTCRTKIFYLQELIRQTQFTPISFVYFCYLTHFPLIFSNNPSRKHGGRVKIVNYGIRHLLKYFNVVWLCLSEHCRL